MVCFLLSPYVFSWLEDDYNHVLDTRHLLIISSPGGHTMGRLESFLVLLHQRLSSGNKFVTNDHIFRSQRPFPHLHFIMPNFGQGCWVKTLTGTSEKEKFNGKIQREKMYGKRLLDFTSPVQNSSARRDDQTGSQRRFRPHLNVQYLHTCYAFPVPRLFAYVACLKPQAGHSFGLHV